MRTSIRLITTFDEVPPITSTTRHSRDMHVCNQVLTWNVDRRSLVRPLLCQRLALAQGRGPQGLRRPRFSFFRFTCQTARGRTVSPTLWTPESVEAARCRPKPEALPPNIQWGASEARHRAERRRANRGYMRRVHFLVNRWPGKFSSGARFPQGHHAHRNEALSLDPPRRLRCNMWGLQPCFARRWGSHNGHNFPSS